MENASKALYIAAGVLIGVMLLSVFVYFLKNIAVWPQAEGEMLSTEQKAKFNEEYEVYDKKAMYGVDVVSCLNKAKSNNEKYAESGVYYSGGKNSAYYIDVYVRITSALEETLTVYYYNSQDKEVQSFETSTGIRMGDAGFENLPDTSGDSNYYTSFYKNLDLHTQSVKLEGAGYSNKYMQKNGGSNSLILDGTTISGYYSLREDQCLQNILIFSTDMKQTVTNKTGTNLDKWSSAVWETALYDFKKKRFKCDYMEYSGTTGLICKIYFSEI